MLYDPDNVVSAQFLNSVLGDNSSDVVDFVFNRHDNQSFTCSGFVTNVSTNVAVGAVQAVSVSFQISGKPKGVF